MADELPKTFRRTPFTYKLPESVNSLKLDRSTGRELGKEINEALDDDMRAFLLDSLPKATD